jgi:hypothetical protein
MAAIVAPTGDRSIATMRVCLVSGFTAVFKDAGVDRARDLGLLVFRAVERAADLVFDLDLVMGSSEVRATPSAAPPQPHRASHSAGQTLQRASAAPSHYSNAPNKPESQSILSKIVAHWMDG